MPLFSRRRVFVADVYQAWFGAWNLPSEIDIEVAATPPGVGHHLWTWVAVVWAWGPGGCFVVRVCTVAHSDEGDNVAWGNHRGVGQPLLRPRQAWGHHQNRQLAGWEKSDQAKLTWALRRNMQESRLTVGKGCRHRKSDAAFWYDVLGWRSKNIWSASATCVEVSWSCCPIWPAEYEWENVESAFLEVRNPWISAASGNS